jgi:hypothetical protein
MEARSPQWMGEVRAPLPALPGTPLRDDPAYQRKGTAHMFRACAPCIGQRSTTVTAQRTQGDWAILSEHLVINMIRMGKNSSGDGPSPYPSHSVSVGSFCAAGGEKDRGERSDPCSSPTRQVVQPGGECTPPSASAMPWGSYRDPGHTQPKGPRVEPRTAREACQGPWAVDDRRRPRETEKTLS